MQCNGVGEHSLKNSVPNLWLSYSDWLSYWISEAGVKYKALHYYYYYLISICQIVKPDRVGPVDNTPSTKKLHNFVKKKREKKKKMWHVTRDTWHMTCDMWHVTCDTWHMTCYMFGGVNILSKFQLPSSYCLLFMILWRSGGKGWLT